MKRKLFRAELYMGRVKKTKFQRKKHVLQMTKEEINFLKQQIKLIPVWHLKESKHVKKKKVSFNIDDIEKTLQSVNVEDYIVEYSETTVNGVKERRILVESPIQRMVKFKTYKKQVIEELAKMSVVISLETNEIVTVFWNKVDDNHDDRDWKRYSKRLKIIQQNTEKAVS